MAYQTREEYRDNCPRVPVFPGETLLYGPLLEVMADLRQPGIMLEVQQQPGQSHQWRKSLFAALRRHAPVPPKRMRWRTSRATAHSQYVYLDTISAGRQCEWALGGSEVLANK